MQCILLAINNVDEVYILIKNSPLKSVIEKICHRELLTHVEGAAIPQRGLLLLFCKDGDVFENKKISKKDALNPLGIQDAFVFTVCIIRSDSRIVKCFQNILTL